MQNTNIFVDRCTRNKIFVAVLICILLLSEFLAINTYAENINIVYTDTVIQESENEIVVPIMIKNNSGFMGFAMEVAYNSESISVIEAQRGDLLSTGVFNDSISALTDGNFKVIFNSTQNINGDGELFVIKFIINEKTMNDQVIKLSYSADDTFDENWNDVVFNCNDIVVKIENNENHQNSSFERFISLIKKYFEKLLAILGIKGN